MAMATQRRRTGRRTKVRSVAQVEPWIERPVVTAPVPAPVATTRRCILRDGVAAQEVPRLSPLEAQILASITRGESMKQAARALGISEKTVENLQRRLHLELGARTRAQAVARAHALGLLLDDGRAMTRPSVVQAAGGPLRCVSGGGTAGTARPRQLSGRVSSFGASKEGARALAVRGVPRLDVPPTRSEQLLSYCCATVQG